MFHYVNSIQNTRGDALIGYFVQLTDTSSGDVVDIFADDNGTPIVTASGVVNMAEVDADGNASFFVESGSYHINIYATDGVTFLKQIENVPMITPGDFITDATLADTGGAALVGTSDGGTVQDAVDRIGTFVGYDTGQGGTVTQLTSKTTAVTLDAMSGQIVTHNSSIAAGSSAFFFLNNSNIAATDIVIVQFKSEATASHSLTEYQVRAGQAQAGKCGILIKNESGGALAETLTLNFMVLKGVNS